jgi:hypothetical protein
VVAAGETLWVVYRIGNNIHAVAALVTSVGPPIDLAVGPRLNGTVSNLVASGEADGTLGVAWLDSGLGYDTFDSAVSSRRVLPDGTLTPTRTLVTGTSLANLRSITYGPRTSLTFVSENALSVPTPSYAIRH